MNFEQALLWRALTVMTGIFVFIFYALIKEQRDGKEESDNKNKKPRARKPTPIPSGKRVMAETSQGCNGIVSQTISQGNVNVVNITNYPNSSDPASISKNHFTTTGGRTNVLRDVSLCPALGSAKDVISQKTSSPVMTERLREEKEKVIES